MFEKYIEPFNHLLRGTKTELMSNGLDSVINYLYGRIDSRRLYEYNIYIPKGCLSSSDLFVDVIKPELYVEDNDCGIYLRGLEPIRGNKKLLNFYQNIIMKEPCYYSEYLEDELKLSYVKKAYWKDKYIKADKEHKKLIAESMYIRNTDCIIKNLMYDGKFTRKIDYAKLFGHSFDGIEKNVFIEFLGDMGISTADAIKFMVLNKIVPETMFRDMFEAKKFRGYAPSRMTWILGDLTYRITLDNKNVEYTAFTSDGVIFKALAKSFPNNIENYIKNNIKDFKYLLYLSKDVNYMCTCLLDYEIVNVKLEDENIKVYVKTI